MRPINCDVRRPCQVPCARCNCEHQWFLGFAGALYQNAILYSASFMICKCLLRQNVKAFSFVHIFTVFFPVRKESGRTSAQLFLLKLNGNVLHQCWGRTAHAQHNHCRISHSGCEDQGQIRKCKEVREGPLEKIWIGRKGNTYYSNHKIGRTHCFLKVYYCRIFAHWSNHFFVLFFCHNFSGKEENVLNCCLIWFQF